jgi:PKD repeat protein
VSKAYTTAGTYTVSVFAQATTGQTGSAFTTAQIGGAQTGQLQVSAGGPYAGAVGGAIVFTAQATLNGAPVTAQAQFVWAFGDGTTGLGQSVTKTYQAPGLYTVTVTVTLNTGQTASASTAAQIGGAGTGALQVSAGGPYTGQVGVPVTFTAQAVFNGVALGSQAQYQWSFGDGTVSAGQTTTKTYTIAGTYTVSVTATLPTGQTGTASTTVQISGAQTGTLQVSAGGPYSAAVGQPVTLTASVVNLPPGAVVNFFAWSFGDGTTGVGQTVSKTYTTAGTFTVTVAATASTGQTGTGTTTVVVGGSGSIGATEQIALFPGCNNVAVTWPNGTAMSVVAAAISPANPLIAVWRFDNIRQLFVGYSTLPGAPNDLITVNRAEPVFICMNGSGTLTRPVI